MLPNPTDNSRDIPWRDRPLQPMKTAAEIAGISVASLYRYAAEGRLTFRKLAGRTLVDTASLIELIDSADAGTPSTRTRAACAKRASRASQSWA
jgi:predicted site-specific integrase-resolvase